MRRASRAKSSHWLLAVLGLLLALNWLYVPWTYVVQQPGRAVGRSPAQYAWLHSPPEPRRRVEGVEIDFGRVLLQSAAIGAIGLVGLCLLRIAGDPLARTVRRTPRRPAPPED